MGISFKRAGCEDARKIFQFIKTESYESAVLRRSLEEISGCTFFTAWLDGELVGTTGYKIWSVDGPEIIGHVVKHPLRGQGIGSKLVKLCLADLRAKGYGGSFALVVDPESFMKKGFYEISKSSLNQKTRTDCQFCKKKIGDWNDPQCDEIAMRVKF